MDVEEEWELLSDEGFLDINDDHIYSRKSAATVFQTNYFICPPPSVDYLLPVPIDLPPPFDEPVQILKMESFDEDPISQVFFKKMKEAEFVDMKVESPKSSSAIVPQIGGTNFQFEEKAEEMIEGGGDEGVWKRGLSGIGAICSFGVAAATFCIIIFTNRHPHHNHKLHFRIYTHDDNKRMKVNSAVSGVPISKARITVGGYYDASLSLSL